MSLRAQDRSEWISDASRHLQERATERRQRRAAWRAAGGDPATDPSRTTCPPDEPVARQLDRRRSAAARLECLPHDSRRDPHRPRRDDEPPGVGELDACARAQAYLRTCGLTGLPSAPIRRAWAALPERYGSVLPRWPAA